MLQVITITKWGNQHFDLTINCVPPMLQVLKWLPKKTLLRCALINRRFSRIVNDESLWTRLDLGSKILHDGVLAVILSRGVVILRLAQSCIYDPVFGMHKHLLRSPCKVQYLDLSMARISPAGLVELLSHCRQLKKLSLEHVQLNEEICRQIAQNRDIEALNLVLCEGLTPRGIKHMFTSLQSLQSLNLGWASLSAEELDLFCDIVSPTVLRLNISGCRKTMTDDSASPLLRFLLSKYTVSETPFLAPSPFSVLERLVSRVTDIRELDLSDCTLLSPDAILCLARLRSLEYISLSRCYKLASHQSYL